MHSIGEYLDDFGDRVPAALRAELNKVLEKL
jgi:hypothetical protein